VTVAGSPVTRVVWNVGALEPGDSQQFDLCVQSNTPGMVKSLTTVRAQCAQPADASAQTLLQGIPAILSRGH
jgi:hypothetical protein